MRLTFISAGSVMRAEPVRTPIEHRPVITAAAAAYLRDLAGSLRQFDELVVSGDLERGCCRGSKSRRPTASHTRRTLAG
jgi:hypothetical protein